MKICSCAEQTDDELRRDAARYRALRMFVERSNAIGFAEHQHRWPPKVWTAIITEQSFDAHVDMLRERFSV